MKKIICLVTMALGVSGIRAQQVIDLQAHRGGRGLRPENSVPAMLHAVEVGARTLELDCVISADGKVVVSHDVIMSSDIMQKPDGSPVENAGEGRYALYKMSYDSIRRFTEGVRRHPKFPEQVLVRTYKPLLAELIDSVEAYVAAHHLKPVYYNIETKTSPAGDDLYHPKPAQFVALLMAVVKSKGILGRVTIQSFDPRTLQVLHQTDPGVTTALLVENTDGFAQNISRLGFTPSIYSPAYSLVNAALVREGHDSHVAVLPWTVNNVDDMKKMAAFGVDGIISDYPDRLVKLFGSYQR